jgi:hypothetical protein
MIKKFLLLVGVSLALVTVISADAPLPPCPPSCDLVSSVR